MAIFECKMFSQELFLSVGINVILPTPDSGDVFLGTKTEYPKNGQKYQVLYLLHGFSADHTDWARFSGIERYAQAKQLAVVMPGANNSMYCNLPTGGNYYNYYTQELPKMMQAIFPISAKRENNFIAGLSMGGFGALKAALMNPDKYAAAASLSGGMGMGDRIKDMAGSKTSQLPKGLDITKWAMGAYGGDGRRASDEDIKVLLKKVLESGKKMPKLYQACGTEDFIYGENISFRDYARSLGADLKYEEGPGIHDWDFWDPYIRKVLDWLPLANGFVE